MTPDKKCPECGGTGVIVLFSSSRKCDCIEQTESCPKKYRMKLDYIKRIYHDPGCKVLYPGESVHEKLKGDIHDRTRK